MSSPARPDLSRRALLALACGVAAAAALALVAGGTDRPGGPIPQLAAALGTLLLLSPAAFAVAKRSGRSFSPPRWFVLHVLGACAGAVLIVFHAAGGRWLSPPGLLLAALALLLGHGFYMRTRLPAAFAGLFAARPHSLQGAVDASTRRELAALIERKRALLAELDADADEALFSPQPRHWKRRPRQSFRYARLAARERGLTDSARAGTPARWSRRLHMLLAWLFLIGVLTHVVVVMLFAGYAAGDGPVYWWHVSAWGR